MERDEEWAGFKEIHRDCLSKVILFLPNINRLLEYENYGLMWREVREVRVRMEG